MDVKDVKVYRVPSETHDDVTYEVTLGEGFGRCTCPDFYYRMTLPMNHGLDVEARACKHLNGHYPVWRDEQQRDARRQLARVKTVTITLPPGASIEVA